MSDQAPIIRIVEGETESKGPLTLKSDGVVDDLTLATSITAHIRDRHLAAAQMVKPVTNVNLAAGQVSINPSPGEFVFAKGHYTLRIRVVKDGVVKFYPSEDPVTVVVGLP